VSGSVTAVPRPPASPWFTTGDVSTGSLILGGPTTATINMTSLSVGFKSSGTGDVYLTFWLVSSTDSNCSVFLSTPRTLYHVPGLPSGAGAFSASFPTPLQVRAPLRYKACLAASQGNGTGPTI